MGQTLTIGTCGVSGASFSGDAYLRLNGPAGNQVAFNDDSRWSRLERILRDPRRLLLERGVERHRDLDHRGSRAGLARCNTMSPAT
jgi:hypothetical protein